jgi:hypothetical protein
MLVKERDVLPQIPVGIEEVEYPAAVIERLDKEFEIVEAQLATGEIEPMSVADFAAEYGIKING